MTVSQRAIEAAAELSKSLHWGTREQDLVQAFQRVIDEERERCAKIVEEAVRESERWSSPSQWTAKSILLSIRGDRHEREG